MTNENKMSTSQKWELAFYLEGHPKKKPPHPLTIFVAGSVFGLIILFIPLLFIGNVHLLWLAVAIGLVYFSGYSIYVYPKVVTEWLNEKERSDQNQTNTNPEIERVRQEFQIEFERQKQRGKIASRAGWAIIGGVIAGYVIWSKLWIFSLYQGYLFWAIALGGLVGFFLGEVILLVAVLFFCALVYQWLSK